MGPFNLQLGIEKFKANSKDGTEWFLTEECSVRGAACGRNYGQMVAV